eukprot:TRINITY_DN28454_c0_g1_i2.p1 TRINITY_DN28454_c0_g1~~TRINITY_DN28454_c0_g1_i2.p1  ORF type:complete len:554 (-),score=41.75 TRINITY_DN28454_c0_g1_i2:219-1880(-)
MDGYSQSELGILCTGVVLLLAYVASSINFASCLEALISALAATRRSLVSCAFHRPRADETKCAGKAVDEVEEEVSRLMCERQTHRMKTCCSVVSHALSIFVGGISGAAWQRAPRWMSMEQDALVMLLFSVVLIMKVWVSFGRQLAVFSGYSVFMAFSAIWIFVADFSSATSGDVMLYVGVTSCLIRLIASVNVMHFRIAVVWNVLCSVSNCCKYIISDNGERKSSVNFVFFEAIQCITVMLLSESIRCAHYTEVYYEVKSAAGRSEKSATTTLLDNMCDVVLPLDSKLTITEDVPRFKGMLMLNPNSSTDGLRLDGFIPSEEDKQRLNEQLSDCCSSGRESVVKCLTVTMRDSDGNDMCVEMHGVAFKTLNMSTQYMLGVRELSDSNVRLAPLRENLEQDDQPREDGPLRLEAREVATYAADQAPGSHAPAAGTPPSVAVARSRPKASAAPPNAAATRTRPLQHFQRTSEKAKLASTINLVASWNFSSRHRSCCDMHVGLGEVKRILKHLRRLPCMHDLHDGTVEQCSACGILDCYESGLCCKVCGHEGRVRL